MRAVCVTCVMIQIRAWATTRPSVTAAHGCISMQDLS